MLNVVAVDAGDGHVGPHDVVASQHNTGIGDTVAAQRTPFTQHGSEFSKPAPPSFAVDAEVNLTTVVAQVAEFGPCTEVDALAEDGVADVIEMWSLGPWQQDGVLHFGGVTDHGIGANPRMFAYVGTAANHGPWTDVARADQVRALFHGGRFVHHHAFTSVEEPLERRSVFNRQGRHLRLQVALKARVEQTPRRAVAWEHRESPVF